MEQMTTSNGSKPSASAIEELLIQGNLGGLNPEQRVTYYNRVCESVGLNPLTQPFEYITLNGKLRLYAKRDATDQLRKVHRVAVIITDRRTENDVHTVTARATTPDGRTDESTGSVSITGLKGENLANAFMKAETKAKRRVTLSICGLGWLDETEVESMREVRQEPAKTLAEVTARLAPLPVTLTPDEIAHGAEVARERRESEYVDPGPPDVPQEEMTLAAKATALVLRIASIDNLPHLRNWKGAHRNEVNALPPADKARVAEAWTNKEAELKAAKKGTKDE